MKLIVVSLLISQTIFSQPGNTWSATGPTMFPGNISGQINGIGRVSQIKFHPTNPKKMYAVSASGGLWISPDTATTWVKTGTDQLPQTSCASICIDFTDDNILYLGTGDANYYSTYYGVWKSTDGGQTWNQSTTGMGNRLPIEILMDPTNHDVLVAATDNGIYRSTNAGANWTLVKSSGDFKDMQFKPGSNTTLYAVTSSQFWRSTDFGATWTQITNGVVIPGGGSGLGMRIAVSAASPNVVYVGMIKDGGTILKSTDGGTSFTQIYHNTSESIVDYGGTYTWPTQGNYNFSMTADPTNANTVYVVAHVVWKSTDGGVNWTQMTDWWLQLHTDMHGIKFHPTYTGKLFNNNDGGVWISNDKGDNWAPKSDGLGATEIYHASQSPVQRNLMSIGTQDNGELYFQTNAWNTNRGGDWGSYSFFDYVVNNNRVYYHENGNRRVVTGNETSFNPPFSPASVAQVATNLLLEFTRKVTTLGFIGGTNVWRTTTLNNANPAWTQILNVNQTIKAMNSSVKDSTLLYVVTANSKIYRSNNALAATPTFTNYNTPAATNLNTSIATVKTNSNVVYISCGSSVFRSTNQGATWTNITANLPGVNIIKIIHDEYSSNEDMYVCTGTGVYYKDVNATNWTNISYNLPSVADIREFMIYNDGTPQSLLRVGYYGRGVWELPLHVNMAPTANFNTSVNSACTNSSIQLTDISTGSPTAWSWSVTPSAGAAVVTPTVQNPSVTFANAGTYTISLTATNANGSGSTTKTITVVATPTVSVNSATICSGQTVVLTASGATSYSWSTGANTSTTSVAPSATTNYTVTGNTSGCSNTKTVSVTVKNTPTVSVTNTTICSGNSVVISATGATTYSWSTGASTASISVSPSSSTNYTVIGTTSGCVDTKTVSVSVNTTPTVTANSTSVCVGSATVLTASGAATYSWNTGATTSTISVSPVSTTIYTVTGTTTGCSDTKTVSVAVNQLPNVAVSSITICAGSTGTLSASGANSYTWNTGATTSTLAVSPSVSTNYTVTGTSLAGCTKSQTVSVIVGNAPAISVNNPTICIGTSATLTASGVTTYTWNTGSNNATISVNPSATTIYTISGNLSGCTSTVVKTATVTVNVPVTPTITPIPATLCVNNGTVALSATPPGGSFSGPGVTGNTFDPFSSGTGTITINYSYIDANNCSASSIRNVVVNLCTGIEELEATSISVYPNPAKDKLVVKLDRSYTAATTIELFDVVGKLVMVENTTAAVTNLNVSKLAKGVYTVVINSSDHKSVIVMVIKE